MKKYHFFVSGMHCNSCKIFIEESLKEFNFIKSLYIDIKRNTLEIEIEESENIENIILYINNKIKEHGYLVSKDQNKKIKNNNEIWTALPIGVGLILLFFLLQKSGILNIGFGGNVTPITSFVIGIVASVSSCLAIVGGLVLSLSAKISQDNKSDTKIFTLFHLSRIITFAFFGGILGIFGGIIGFSFTLAAILGILASIIMLLLGLNLIGFFEKNHFTLSSKIFNNIKKIEYKNASPIILGFATFFLPCGFTQSMQFQALDTGTFWEGFLIMFAFALGTFPVLALLSFGSKIFSHKKYSNLFFKTTGVVVIGLGLFSLLAGLASLGFIEPIFNI